MPIESGELADQRPLNFNDGDAQRGGVQHHLLQCGTALLQLGCELAQGYAIARAMPAQAFPAWCATWKSDPAWLV